MDNLNLYSALAVIILGSILIPFVSKESIFNEILIAVGFNLCDNEVIKKQTRSEFNNIEDEKDINL